MATIRICDRCKAPADQVDNTTSERTFIVPANSPSTNPVTKDCEVSMSMVIAPADLCGVCQASALLEYMLGRVTPDLLPLMPVLLKAFSARVLAAQKAVTP